MKFLTFILTYPIIWIISRLPMRVLYIISDVFFFIMYYLIGYRKKVVFDNIKTAFPKKSDKEVKTISKKFFRHFVDLVFESVKSFSISKKEIDKRYHYENLEVINDLAKKGRSIILTGSHHNNWEWSFALPAHVNMEAYGAYMKIQNPYYEKVIKDSRTRFGYDGVPTGVFRKEIEKRFKENKQSFYILLSDQSPQVHKTKYWKEFLNVKVPVHIGAETLAKEYNFAIVNMCTTKVKRGYYTVKFNLLTDNPISYKDYELTDIYLKQTEEHIKTQPEYYLWSHKRFKHQDKYDVWLEKRKTSLN